MTEMVDRVARAILSGYEWESITPELQAEYRRMGRAAIEAMREPSKKMLHATYTGMPDRNMVDLWHALIDAALAPEQDE